jgi:hypothetical protein
MNYFRIKDIHTMDNFYYLTLDTNIEQPDADIIAIGTEAHWQNRDWRITYTIGLHSLIGGQNREASVVLANYEE